MDIRYIVLRNENVQTDEKNTVFNPNGTSGMGSVAYKFIFKD